MKWQRIFHDVEFKSVLSLKLIRSYYCLFWMSGLAVQFGKSVKWCFLTFCRCNINRNFKFVFAKLSTSFCHLSRKRWREAAPCLTSFTLVNAVQFKSHVHGREWWRCACFVKRHILDILSGRLVKEKAQNSTQQRYKCLKNTQPTGSVLETVWNILLALCRWPFGQF